MQNRNINAEVISEFRESLRREEKSAYTIEKYTRDARAFVRFAGKRGLSKDLLIEYKSKLVSDGYGNASINSMLASINSLLKFIGRQDCTVANIRVQKSPYRAEERNLSRSEYLKLKSSAAGKPRLCLIIETLACTGIRISELKYFTVEALRKGGIEVCCKNKVRTVMVPSELRKRLLSYAKRSGITSGVIFRTRYGNPVNRSNVWSEMKRLCEKANIAKSKVFPHNFRKLFARLFYEISKDISQLADLLGHCSINTTRIYIMTTENEVRRKVESVSRMLYTDKKKNTTLSA